MTLALVPTPAVFSKLINFKRRFGKKKQRPESNRQRTCCSSPLPSLPNELVLLIFDYATSTHTRSSQANLAVLSRLSKATRDLYTPQLYAHPILASPTAAINLAKTLKKRQQQQRVNTSLNEQVVVLTLDGSSGDRCQSLAFHLPRVMRFTPKVEQVILRHVTVYSIVAFKQAQHLKHLVLIDSLISDRTSTTAFAPYLVTLPSLESLTLQSSSSSTSSPIRHQNVLEPPSARSARTPLQAAADRKLARIQPEPTTLIQPISQAPATSTSDEDPPDHDLGPQLDQVDVNATPNLFIESHTAEFFLTLQMLPRLATLLVDTNKTLTPHLHDLIKRAQAASKDVKIVHVSRIP